MSGNIYILFVDFNFVSQGIELSKEKVLCSSVCNLFSSVKLSTCLASLGRYTCFICTSRYFHLIGMIETRTISLQMPMPALMSEEKTATNTSTTSRQRPGSACEECRRRKLRCDRQPQCGNCVEAGVVCTTTTVRPARGPKKGHLKALKGRIGKASHLSCVDTMLTAIASNT